MSFLCAEAHAKINLTLHIAARRSDGYHDIETVMKAIPLCDLVTVSAAEGIEISCDKPFVPTDERNIAYKAAKLFFDRSGIAGGAKIDIVKRIPVCGGLGGGSSDGAAVLKLLNRLYNAAMSVDDLVGLAALLGSDVPFFIEEKTSLCTGRGEVMEHIEDNSTCAVSVNVWGKGASTALMYAEADKSPQARRSPEEVIHALRENDLQRLAAGIFNDFEPVCNRLRPDTARLKEAYLREGAAAACLCGSGASVFGLFANQTEADRVGAKLANS